MLNVSCLCPRYKVQTRGEYHFKLSKTFLFFVWEIIDLMSAIFVLSIMSITRIIFKAFSRTAIHHLHTQSERTGTRSSGIIIVFFFKIDILSDWSGPDPNHHRPRLLQPGLLHRAGRRLGLHGHPHRLLLGHHHHDHRGVG